MSRRAATLVVASVLILVLGTVGVLLPVPYVALTPGPTTNTLGKTDKGQPLIRIEGRRVYDDGGHLNFTTVAYQGGPDNRIDLFTALKGWLDDDTAIVPEETIFPKDETTKQVEEENSRQMEDSQQQAVAAALRELKIPVTSQVLVDSVQRGMPADGRLRPNDEIVAVDGTRIRGVSEVTAAITKHQPGQPVKVTIKRGGKEQQVTITTTAGQDGKRPIIGVVLRDSYKFPFKVDITVGDIGGPSAGLMFSLAIVDKLTPGSLTGGRFIAGTGTIDSEAGKVGPIGGIQQKMIAARQAGATVFLTPKDNCDDARSARPKGLRLVRADTLHEAVTTLDALRTGQAQAQAPAC